MSEDNSQMQQMKPYLIVAGVLFILLIVVVFWPSKDTPIEADVPQVPVTDIVEPSEMETEPSAEPEVFEPPQMPTEVVIGEESDPVQDIEPVIEAPIEVEEPQELDISDMAVKAAVVQSIRSPQISQFLVSDALLQKFVINVNNLANEEITLKDNLLVAPENDFATYQQADKLWIDRSSFQRYTPYVDAVEAVDTEELLAAYESYKPILQEKFAEISRPGEELNQSIIRAIDELLDTPQVQVPIEVISETVMYKFADPKLEALSGPQKQMIRMGPDNMRRLKDVLREIKAELEARQ
jgi:hypothetical protein